MLGFLDMAKRKSKQLSTFRFTRQIRAALKIQAAADGLSQGALLERAFLLYRSEVSRQTKEQREALALEAERRFANIAQDKPE